MDNMAGNIFLVGLPGCGKTTLGKVLAQELQHSFFDADQFLIEKSGVSIPTIFELEGEEGFRKREQAVIAQLVRFDNIVLATGGGVVLLPENRKLLARYGHVIYLHTLPELLYQRVLADKNRPLLQVDDPLKVLCHLYQQRDHLYREIADCIVEVQSGILSQVLNDVLLQLNKRAN